MVRIELTPTLTHCIETAAREIFSRSTDEYMRKGEEDKELEEKIHVLRMFLETANFRELRRESEKYLVEGRSVRFILYLEEGKVKCEMKAEQ